MRWTLRVKLVLGIAVIMIATMGSSLLLLTINTRNQMMEDYRNFAIHLSDMAEAGLENAMISREPERVTSIMQAIGRREGIEGGSLFNRRGEIKYSIDPKDVGRIFSINDPTCRLCHGITTPKDRPQTVILPSKQGASMLRVTRAFNNHPRCQGCHREQKLGMLVIDFSLAKIEQKTVAAISKQFRYTLMVAVIIIAALIGFVYLMVTRPLAHFVRIIRAINAGDLSRRVHLTREDEIGELGSSFDSMVQHLNTRTQELELSEERFRGIFEEGPVGIVLANPDHKIVAANNVLCELLGYSEQELVGQNIIDLTYEEDREKSRILTGQLLEGSIPRFRWEKRYVRRDGGIVWVNLTATTFHGKETQMPYFLGIIEDLTESRKTAEKIHLLSYYDGLTSLPNRTFFKELMQRSIEHAKRHKEIFALIYIGLDNFQRIN
ncbi:MAG: PAS domain S-box protein, partial [Pseudomonadota bacterium]